MAHLLRIVMIHGHLEGVVELNVDGHTNICGTNASGKTTLQRLVPVFYGELPNKVVPRTRQKFDQFYLPHRNSYLVYEYRREAGDVCQAVLTRKSDGGVEYRFVSAPYRPEDYLVTGEGGVTALDYAQWANGLRRQGVDVSQKIGASSEYRAVIQNDFTQQYGNSREALRLRQMAARFSLVRPAHRIRHMEKLVSAVHAKEGKMDTLKTMLAAIFEEDGVELPVTRIRNTKAREWIARMRQSMRLAPLQRALEDLQRLDREMAELETSLCQLHPRLKADHHHAQRSWADLEARLNELRRDFRAREQAHEEARGTLDDRISALDSELKRTRLELDDLQRRFEAFKEADMPGLERDLQSLPQWREELQQLRDHLELMQQAAQESKARLNARLVELGDLLERRREETQARIDALDKEKDACREARNEQEERLEADHQRRRKALDDDYRSRLDEGANRLAELKARLAHEGQTTEEAHEARQVQARVDQAQGEQSAAAAALEAVRGELDERKRERDTAERDLELARQQRSRAEARLDGLLIQRDPAQGSLRHFLRHHRPGWEQSLGKVIAPELLQRRDLAPQFNDGASDDLYGLVVDLAAIALPDHAQDEATLLAGIEAAQQALDQARKAEEAAEKALKARHDKVQEAAARLDRARSTQRRAAEEVDYALQARSQCWERHEAARQTRQAACREELNEQEAQQQALNQEREQALEALADTHRAQRQALSDEFTGRLADFDEQIAQYRGQLTGFRQENRRQREELEAAFERELAEQGVDTVSLNQTRSRLEALEQRIRQTERRREELEAYTRFMRVDWGERKPQLVARESELGGEHQSAVREREHLKQQFDTARREYREAVADLEKQRGAQQQLIDTLAPLLTRLDALHLEQAPDSRSEAPGDVSERIERVRQALTDHARTQDELRRGCEKMESDLIKGASTDFHETLEAERTRLEDTSPRRLLGVLVGMLQLLEGRQEQLQQEGRNLGDDLDKFFTVFRDLNRRINAQSRRLSDEVADDLKLEGIGRAEVKIQSTIDELGFWEPLKRFTQHYRDWRDSGQPLPGDDYLDALADVVELLRSDQQYSFESLLRLELHLNEGGTDLVIKSDRQLLESSSHGMAYLILCKFLLAFTRLLRGEAQVAIHWPIDEIGTLAYHNVEKIFDACDNNRIHIVGAFPNPESDVLLLFRNRYLIDRDEADPAKRRLKRIEPRLSRLAQRLQARTEEVNP
ncbi:ATP-binding protein [Ectothiorhodospira variabilis]|uniref:ATP-binding protein n=1 Tax=Ectothiorhodospira variabilis TaxID=505694 RepID=UPI001EFC0470|nr:ATP-binding protein [Ectothiorhodospira variabilis]MCG5495185.1 ATP-binding protein [Ectothiorhodospira variabilis]MCG5504265.1 ATP-binding protein [Ectothiorhodospira variabilis]MCG5507420.1 ATP-binding protein [Ectothiorhodospira variabilis]